MLRTSGSNIQETREDTACIENLCSVKGYQECWFSVDVGEEFLIYKKVGSRGRAFKVTNTRGQLGHLEQTLLVSFRHQEIPSEQNCIRMVQFCLIGSKIKLTAK